MDLGTLHLPTEAPSLQHAAGWTGIPEHRWMLVAAAAVLLFLLPELLKLLPTIIGAIPRRRGNLEIEHSISVARSRNFCARLMCIPVLVAADRYSLCPAAFISSAGEPMLRFAWLAGLLAAYFLLRVILHRIIFAIWPPSLDSESQTTVLKGAYSYFVLYSVLMMVSICVLSIAGVYNDTIRLVLWIELALLWSVSLLRERQILASVCSGLGTFLYLCGLELLPAGALVCAALLL